MYGITYKKCVLKNKNQIIDGVIPTNFATPILVGDYVRIEAKNDVFVVKKVLPRKNELIRPKCANVDVVLIIYPVDKLKKCHDLL